MPIGLFSHSLLDADQFRRPVERAEQPQRRRHDQRGENAAEDLHDHMSGRWNQSITLS